MKLDKAVLWKPFKKRKHANKENPPKFRFFYVTACLCVFIQQIKRKTER